MWKHEIKPLQERYGCQIYGNKCAWWNAELSVKFLKFPFANRPNLDENILLIWDAFSGHWTTEVEEYAASINVILLKVECSFKGYDCKWFCKIGILGDTRVEEDEMATEHIESAIVEELEKCNLAGGQVDSDDDIGSGDEHSSDSE
ncbi:unnamed protein product [Phytophthora lilii]|uniref:Unnamed protein product n=1 Tax=Phytophthora lilii TaxID=2077276 RepID=A0A9W6TS11_9STRA|nr:unnamed protein product [Phytophthora lilii]